MSSAQSALLEYSPPENKIGLYLGPKVELDCFDDETIQSPDLPSWYEPEMITDPVITFHKYQQEAIASALNAFLFEDVKTVRLVMPTGTGKCLGYGTPVLMFDGTVKPVQDVVVGDELMGPDSAPRTVLSLARGVDNLYRVTPKKGDPYVVNEAHILSLKMTGGTEGAGGKKDGEIVNIPVSEYLQKSKTFRHCAKGYRVGIDFPEKPLELNPYFMGLWLGDGHSWSQSITSVDNECIAFLQGYATALGMQLTTRRWKDRAPNHNISGIPRNPDTITGARPNAIKTALRKYKVLNNKHIPIDFKTNSRENRLQLLAGLIDSDGSLNANGYDLIFKVERLANDAAFLARSLGLAAYVQKCEKTCTNNGVRGTYHRISISGNTDEIPVRIERKKASPRKQIKDVLMTGITVEPIGHGEYFGFEISGDRLFLLGDFTVTHNTITFNALAKILLAMDYRILILVHRNDLLRQACDKLLLFGIVPLVEQGRQRALAHFCGNQRIVVASVQSMHKQRVQLWPRDSFDFIISDEAHHVRSDEKNHWWRVSKWFNTAKHFGVTATPGVTKKVKGKKRYVNIPGWEKDIEPIQLLEAIEGGYLCPLVFKKVKTNIDLRSVGRVFGDDSDFKQSELDAVIFKNTNRLATAIKENIGTRPTIAFTPLVASAEGLAAALNDIGVLARAVSAETPDRLTLYAEHERGDFQVLVNCMVCTEGWDGPYIECVVIARPTQSINVFLQIIGRGTRTSKKTGKTNCLIVDFAFVTGDLPLVGAAEMLREKLADETEEDAELLFEAADEILQEDTDLSLAEVLEAARKKVEEQKERERIRLEKAAIREAELEALRIKNREEKFRYTVTTLDPFATNLLGIPEQAMNGFSNPDPASAAQIQFIQRMSGGRIKTNGMSKSAAGAVIAELKSSLDEGRSTYGQRDLMVKRMGVDAETARNMTKDEASVWIEKNKQW